MYLNFMFLDQLPVLFECKHTLTHARTHAHTDSEEYSMVVFCKNATITTVNKLIFKSFRPTMKQ